jgi:HEAT repeat protein
MADTRIVFKDYFPRVTSYMKLNIIIIAIVFACIAGIFIFIPPRDLLITKDNRMPFQDDIDILGGQANPMNTAALSRILKRYDDIKHEFPPYEAAESLIRQFRENTASDDEHNREIRRRIMRNMGRQALVPMLKLLERGKPHEKLNALLILGRLKEPLSLPGVVKAASDPDALVRMNAIITLEAIRLEAWGLGLEVRNPESGTPNPKPQAPSPKVEDVFYKALNDPDHGVRYYAFHALAQRLGGNILPFCKKYAQDPDPSMRTLVLETIGSISAKSEIQSVLSGLTDESVEVRKAALYALGRVGSKEHAARAREFLDSSLPEIRMRAAFAIGHIGPPEMIPDLEALLEDENEKVREAAAQALERIGPR